MRLPTHISIYIYTNTFIPQSIILLDPTYGSRLLQTALHNVDPAVSSQQFLLQEPRMAQLETLEAKMASIEVSLSTTTPRRKKGGSLTGAITLSTGHKNRDYYKEVDALRVALRDKENVIQTLKSQLCNNLSNRLALRNGVLPSPLNETDRKNTEERVNKLERDADNKRLAIKNLKLALERLDITDNIDTRIQQAELEYRLGREELELLSVMEEMRTLQAALELADTQEKQKNDSIFSCINEARGTRSMNLSVYAIEVSADPKSPRFGAGPRDNAPGLYVDWAVEDSGLQKEDRLLEVNGKLVVTAAATDLSRLLGVTPEAAHIVVLRKTNDSLAALRALRSENLRLNHRISYLEEQVRDLLSSPVRTKISVIDPAINRQDVQVFQKGPQVSLITGKKSIENLSTSLKLNSSNGETRDKSLPIYQTATSISPSKSTRSDTNLRTRRHSTDLLSTSSSNLNKLQSDLNYKLMSSKNLKKNSESKSTRGSSAAEVIDYYPDNHQQYNYQQRRKNSTSSTSLAHYQLGLTESAIEFDSEPIYYRYNRNGNEDTQSTCSSHLITDSGGGLQEDNKRRPLTVMPIGVPKKPLRLSLHRATSLQSVESAPPTLSTSAAVSAARKSLKRNYHDDYGNVIENNNRNNKLEIFNADKDRKNYYDNYLQSSSASTPQLHVLKTSNSRTELSGKSNQWTPPKSRRSRSHFSSLTMNKWC
ncbi:uncharacterized protein LOC130665664 isoform X2 [Microplitis mediator]|uniref:uncharacterized protein LOC130665664 isoform X2 n=1 Tax=Microplitis mediator TaxID=375433 RepID=UPI002557A7AC|nr:uncharacterized protein LOC130665664 isoform X2 [Microplitis mediator]